MKSTWVAALLLVAATVPLTAQMTVNVRVIEVPVTVVDRNGDAVRGLTAANFQLFDDGKAQTITAFDAIDFASAPSLTAISPLNVNARRSFLLLFDLGYSDMKMLQRAREAASRFVAASVTPRDLVAVGTIGEKGFRILSGFTPDRTLTAKAITSNLENYRSIDPLQLSDLDSFGAPSGIAPTTLSPGEDTDEAAATALELRELTARANRGYLAGRIGRQMQSLGELAKTLRSVPGRKQVVLLSAGFDPTIVRGRNVRGAMASEMVDMERVISGHGYLVDSDKRFGNSASLSLLDELIRVLKQSDVLIHAIDVAGIRMDAAFGKPTTSVSNDALHFLADPTGGTVFENSNDLAGDLNRMLRQQEVVYVLAFQVTPAKRAKLHDLSVKLVGGPAGATVHNRVAYYDGKAETRVERTLTNAEIIVNDIAQTDIHVAAFAAAVPPAAERASVPLFLEIDGADLLRGATKPVPADIFIYAFDEQGVVRDRVYQRITVDPAKASERVRQKGIKYFATVALPPGRYAVRSLVALPETEKRGFVRTDLVVPGKGEMAVLPPLFLDKPGQWALLDGIRHDGGGAYPFVLAGERFVPSALPRLRDGEAGELALFLYNADPAEMMMQATVTDAKGVTRPAQLSLVRHIEGEGVAKLVFQYAPAGLATGPATLDLLVHKKGSPDIRRATVALLVMD